ncbi:uncharacterized protein E5676_scaffold945G00180 [Cucumis melo var. makuwa]|uniref:CACTA en-spm transposon protein n=1 Tax=Cucumis melo var. makuwa TaxID=1194695 RepID=A0A5D3D5H1_CUCMM|nr:uncharacterized protein E6C27_scaffold673G00190 [Cucumis melo var. makuwa]TYK18801.1 uncharacterized protein E5676_scaffold945G00180 [Cucumis melo var. makuwa]
MCIRPTEDKLAYILSVIDDASVGVVESSVTQTDHIVAGTFVSQAAEDAHGSQPLSRDEIFDQVLGRRPDYSKEREIQIQVKLDQALERIELQDRNYQALASEMEQMRKLIQDMTRAQQGPPHDP